MGFLGQSVGITISGNTTEGVKLLHMSVAESFGGTTVSDNTGDDATCDRTSWLFGDMTEITTVKCANTEQTKKK